MTLRKRFAAVGVVGAALLGVGLGPAHADASNGTYHSSVTVKNGSDYIVVDIYYKVYNQDDSPPPTVDVEVTSYKWNVSSGHKIDALCLDAEPDPGQYTGNQCVGNDTTKSSTTYDDIAPSGTNTINHIWPYVRNQDTPAFRVRVYGLDGQHTRKDGYVPIA